MSNVFKPHRGNANVMANQKKNIVLEAGEMFIELPNGGEGKGLCKMKIGDGVTTYSNLPYAMGTNEDISNSTVTFTNSTSTNPINNVVSGAKLNTIIASLKKTCTDTIATLNSNYAKLNENVTNYGWGAGATAMNGTYTHDITNIPSGYYLAIITAMKSDRGTNNFAFIYLTIGVVGGDSSATIGCGHSGGTNCSILKLPNTTNTVRGTWRMDGLSSAVSFNPSMYVYRIRPL